MTEPIVAKNLDAAGIRHGFFTRQGGVSDGVYASLNCGFGSRDRTGDVAENRSRVARTLAVDPQALNTVHQVHSADVAIAAAVWEPAAAPRADAMVCRTPGIAIGVLTADCGPVLLADSESGVIGAAHAGWRGALDGIVEAIIGAMCDLGASRERIAAALGPCIAQPSYEVGPEFRDAFLAGDDANDAFFVASDRPMHFRFDLPGYVARRLARAGIAAVERLDVDTYAEADRCFSYRRATHAGEDDYGRLISAIALV